MWGFSKKIGLALGSGTARGLAHIGVLKVLNREHVRIDCLSGASLGSLIGAVYALYEEPAVLEQEALKVDWFKLISYLHFGYGEGGLMDNKKVEDFIRHFVGQKNFHDLKIPLAIVAANLENGQEVIITEGPLFEAIRSSIALPFVLAPFSYSGHVFVDGGLLAPVPVAACRKLGATRILAVNLFGDLKSSFKKFSPGQLSPTFSSINSVIQSFFIMENKLARLESQQARVVIEPALGEVDWFDFTKAARCIALGEQATEEKLALIKKL
jgi:NTE family protein